MDLNEIVCAGAVLLAGLAYVVITARRGAAPAWWFPAALGVAFAAWTAYAVADDGPVGFWPLHTASPWGAQVFLDLLLAVGVAWFLLQPRLRDLGVNPWPWLALVAATGSVGLLLTLARLLHAERSDAPQRVPAGRR